MRYEVDGLNLTVIPVNLSVRNTKGVESDRDGDMLSVSWTEKAPLSLIPEVPPNQQSDNDPPFIASIKQR